MDLSTSLILRGKFKDNYNKILRANTEHNEPNVKQVRVLITMFILELCNNSDISYKIQITTFTVKV